MAIRPRRQKRAQTWDFSEMGIMDYVCFLSGTHSSQNEFINSEETLLEARRHYGCDYVGKLKLEDRKRIFPERKWS